MLVAMVDNWRKELELFGDTAGLPCFTAEPEALALVAKCPNCGSFITLGTRGLLLGLAYLLGQIRDSSLGQCPFRHEALGAS